MSNWGKSVPDEEELGDVVDAGAAEADETIEGEVVGYGNDEEGRGSGARVWKRRVRRTSEEVRYASAFAEF